MNYEEIAAKYDGKVREKRSKLSYYKARIDALKVLRETAIAAREQYRNAPISAERSAVWMQLSRRLSKLDERIAAAEIDYGKASIGADENELYKKLGL